MNLILITTSKLPSLLLVLYFSFIITFVSGKGVKCIVHDCGCLCNGTIEISMKAISNPGGSPRFTNVPDTGTHPWKYDINPCSAFSELDTCAGVTMCQKDMSQDPPPGFPVAKLSIESCGDYEKGNPLAVTYKELTYKEATRQMIINLVYGASSGNSKVEQSTTKEDILQYKLTITDPSLNPQPSTPSGGGGGISTGSVMVIIFFVVIVIYLVAGILFMKYKRGATGKEVIPNVEFWSSLPGLIKDGCVFFGKNIKDLCGRCCQREGYSEI